MSISQLPILHPLASIYPSTGNLPIYRQSICSTSGDLSIYWQSVHLLVTWGAATPHFAGLLENFLLIHMDRRRTLHLDEFAPLHLRTVHLLAIWGTLRMDEVTPLNLRNVRPLAPWTREVSIY